MSHVVAYLYHDAKTAEQAHPLLCSMLVVPAAERRTTHRNETPLVTLARAEAMVAAERERLSAVIAEWEKLRDPHTLHVNLLRGFPARLSRSVLLHLAGDEEAKF